MDPLTKFTEQLRAITLSNSERVALRASLLINMRENVVQRPVLSPWSQLFFSKHAQAAFLSIVIVICYGGSVSLAAEGALPGDILYPVKTRVTEPVARLITANSPAAEATFETRLLEKRLEEAESLETGEKLDSKLKQEVREVIHEQRKKAKSKIKNIEDVGAVSVSAVATSTVTVVFATSSPEIFPKETSEENKHRGSSRDDKKDIRNKNEHALKTVLQKHERILEKLNLADDHMEDEREDDDDKGHTRDRGKEEQNSPSHSAE